MQAVANTQVQNQMEFSLKAVPALFDAPQYHQLHPQCSTAAADEAEIGAGQIKACFDARFYGNFTNPCSTLHAKRWDRQWQGAGDHSKSAISIRLQ